MHLSKECGLDIFLSYKHGFVTRQRAAGSLQLLTSTTKVQGIHFGVCCCTEHTLQKMLTARELGSRARTKNFLLLPHRHGRYLRYTASVHRTVEKMKVETLTPSENQSGFLARSFYLATLASGGESLKSSKSTLTFLVNSNENSHTVYFLRNRGYCTMKVWKDQNFFFAMVVKRKVS